MARKHPVNHVVRGHRRTNGAVVRTHRRGSGARAVKEKHLGPAQSLGPKAFTVNFIYSNKKGDGESVIVIADSYAKALEEGYEERVSKRKPIAVELIDPSISSVLSFIGNTAKEALTKGAQAIRKYGVPAAKLGAKYAIKGGTVALMASTNVAKAGAKAGARVAVAGAKAGAQALSHTAKEYVNRAEQSNVQKLIRSAYSEDRLVRNAARGTLKNFYPEVYDIMDFSEPSFTDKAALRKIAREIKMEQRKKTQPPKYLIQQIDY